MSKLALNNEFGLYVKDEIPMCSSRQVAEIFGKRHKNVLESIRALGCSEAFIADNFKLKPYITSRNKEHYEYMITLKGLVMLVTRMNGAGMDEAREFICSNIGDLSCNSILEHVASLDLGKDRLSYVYFIQSDGSRNVKIGRTLDPKGRYSSLNVASPEPLTLLGVIPSSNAAELEARLHRMFRYANVHSEWFYPTEELLDFINSETQDIPNE